MILFEGRFTPVFADSTGSVGSYASVARDADGFIYVSYYDETHGDLRLASNRSGWTTETVDSGGDVGGWTSLQFDWTPIPVLHIAYYDFNNRDLKYATRSPGGSWAIEVVDSSGDVGRGSSIAVNDLTRPVIVYWDATNEHLKYATRTPTGWQREVVDTNVGSGLGWSPSLAIDSTGKPHISYYKDAGRDLYYATKSGTTWVKGPVDQVGDVGRYSTIAAKDDPQPGIPEIAYYDATNGDLKLARQLPGGAWERMVIDATGDVGMYPSLALNHCVGPDCFDPPCPTIVYSDATFGDLRRATRPDGLCSVGHCPFIQDVVVHVGHIEPRGSFNLGVCPGQRRDVIATPIHTGGETQLMVLESRGASSVSDAPAPPGRMLLSFANPFAPPETIRFAIDKSGSVQVKIVDVAGRVVRSLADGTRQAGEHAIAWDGHDEHGALVAQGVYFFNVLVDGRQQAQQKLIVVR